MNAKMKGTALTMLSAVLFGLNPLLAITVYAGGGNAITLTFARVAFGIVLFGSLHCIVDGSSLRVSRAELKKIFICAIGFAATPVLLLSSYNYLASGLATTIHFSYPVLVVIGCVLFCHAKLDRRKVICCTLCSAGILCFYTPGGGISIFGILVSFASAVAYAFYAVYLSNSGLFDMPPFKLACWTNLFAAVMTGLVAAVTGQMAWPTTPWSWTVLVIFSVVIGIASVSFQLGNALIGPQSSSLLSTFEPVTSVIIGVLVYHETLTIRSVLGIICILITVCLLAFAEDTKE